ncbi:MAG: hypothetical protein M1828_000591 [Chrysothrix sp. TS-e1954]|nr:MAG: hypothetical protein M1828_000591 [Chrysothrix sp. TS-e1954]
MARNLQRSSAAFDSGTETPEEQPEADEADDQAYSSGSSASDAAPALIHRFRHDKSILCLATSDQYVYAGSQGGDILWHPLKEDDIRPVPGPASLLSVRPDKFFDSLGPGAVRTSTCAPRARPHPLESQTGRLLEVNSDDIHQFAHFGYVYCMLLIDGSTINASTEEILVSGGGDGAIRLWTLDKKTNGSINLLMTLEDPKDETESVLAFTVDGSFLYSGHIGGEVHVWNLESKQLLRVLHHSDEDVLAIAGGAGQIFCANVLGELQHYDQTFDPVICWKAHGGRILASATALSRGRRLLLTGSSDDTVAVWDITAASPVRHEADSRHHEEELIKSLQTLVSFRTVSANTRYKAECHKGASYLRSVLKQFGAVTESLSTANDTNPVVFACFRGTPRHGVPCKRILFYGHYDVIAAENKQGKWMNDPFTLSGVDGYLYGRGASDNKGPVMASIFAVGDLASKKALTCDVVFLIEGEEENGSKGFESAVESNKHMIGRIDWVLLANSYWLDDEMPCITYGLRGVIHATVEVESDQPDLHSGVDGSRLFDEPLKDLVLITAKLTGPRGVVHLPGFYEPIPPITLHETRLYDDISRNLLERDPGLGSPKTLTRSLLERWRDASLTIHGFKTSGSEKSTIIPHYASVTLSMRLVPDQDVDTIAESLNNFLQEEFEKLGSKNNLTVTINHKAEPWLGDTNNGLFRTLEAAVVGTWSDRHESGGRRRGSSSTTRNPSHHTGKAQLSVQPSSKAAAPTSSTLASSSVVPPERARSPSVASDSTSGMWKPLYIREGGSIPAVRFLEKAFNAPAAHLPCGQASDNAHLDNERIRVVNLFKSRDVFRRVFLGLGELE